MSKDMDDGVAVIDAPLLVELFASLWCVPPGGASGDAPAWLIRLHRAACAVVGTEVREHGYGDE